MSKAMVIGVLAAVFAVTAAVALLLRYRSKAIKSDPLQAARRAIRQSVRDRRRRTRYGIRGKGYGGDDSQGYSAGVASDSGGMP